MGYKLAPEHWNQGYATEALAWLRHHLTPWLSHGPLLAAADSRHGASQRVLIKAGFHFSHEESAQPHGETTRDWVFAYAAR